MDSDKRKLKTKKVVRRKSKREKKTENNEIEKIRGLGGMCQTFYFVLFQSLYSIPKQQPKYKSVCSPSYEDVNYY